MRTDVLREDDIQFVPGYHSGRVIGALYHLRGLARQIGLNAALKSFVPAALAQARGKVYARTTDLLLVKALDGVDAQAASETAPRGSSATVGPRVERIREHHGRELVALRTQPDSYSPGQAASNLEHLGKGYQGFLVRRDERVVGHLWWIDRHIAPSHPHLAAYHIELQDGDVYCFEYFIAPRERGGGIATDALRAMEAQLAELGYQRVWGTVDAAHTAARWLYMTSGWSVAHQVRTVQLLGFRRATVIGAARGDP
jgi:RimJ/RimL family protein N-acetyltransferase